MRSAFSMISVLAVGHIHAGFDDGGAYQHVDFVLHELPPDLGELVLLAHLAVAEARSRASGNLRLDAARRTRSMDSTSVVQVVDLAAAPQFPADGLVDDRRRRVPAHRSAPDGGRAGASSMTRHIADAGQRHIQGAGDGRCGQGQHVHVVAERTSTSPSAPRRTAAPRR